MIYSLVESATMTSESHVHINSNSMEHPTRFPAKYWQLIENIIHFYSCYPQIIITLITTPNFQNFLKSITA